MFVVYRYIDLNDMQVKYIGIVTGKTRCLEGRLREHRTKDEWTTGIYTVEYFLVNSKTDAEAFESHLIALYQTHRFYNKAKKDWGLSDYLPKNPTWKHYITYNGKFVQSSDRVGMETADCRIVDMHKRYAIWFGKDRRWGTTVPDTTKKSGRRIIRKTSKDDLIRYLEDFYITELKC